MTHCKNKGATRAAPRAAKGWSSASEKYSDGGSVGDAVFGIKPGGGGGGGGLERVVTGGGADCDVGGG